MWDQKENLLKYIKSNLEAIIDKGQEKEGYWHALHPLLHSKRLQII
jgi:hypothetical protein